MNAPTAPLTHSGEERPWRGLARWLVCGVIVLSAHAGAMAALIAWRAPVEDTEVGTDAIIVEFQPEQLQTEPTPEVIKQVEKDEPVPEQQSEAMLPPKLQEILPEPPQEEVPYLPPRPAQSRAKVETWNSAVAKLLERNKRQYPADARARDEQGVTQLAFRVDRDGHLISSRIVKSSGSTALNAEVIALLQRAQPFPPPPPELVGQETTMELRFNIRN